MRTKIHLALLMVFTALSVSCKKSSNTTPTPVVTTKLKYLTQQISVDSSMFGVSTRTTNYSYDAKKRLISQSNGSNTITYTYKDNGDLYLITNSAPLYTEEFSYADGKISTVVRHGSATSPYTLDNYGFVYNGSNVTELHANGDNGYHLTVYTYDSNNNMLKSDLDLEYIVTEYTYDNKKSPYTNWPQQLKNPLSGSADICSSNNVTSQKANGGTATTYTYTYGSDGYATSRKRGNSVQSTKNTFIYTEL
jgi:hypothetical protein